MRTADERRLRTRAAAESISIVFSMALLTIVFLVPAARAGSYNSLEPGVATRPDVDNRLGQPVRVVEPNRELEYDPRGTGRRILVGYGAASQIVRFIELEPDEAYMRSDYAGWFKLDEPTFAHGDANGNWVEYYLVQGLSLHFAGRDDQAPVRFFRHFDRDAFLAVEDASAEEHGQGGLNAAGIGQGPDSYRGIFGVWRWFNGAMVECLDDGRCIANNGYSGPWRSLDAPGHFEIRWTRLGQQNVIVDTLELSADGWELQGRGQTAQSVGAQRAEFSSSAPLGGCNALVGRWRWTGGAQVECTPDGMCTASNGLSGPWRCILPSGRFEIRWGRAGRPNQFTDSLVISPLGSYLTGKNQFGVAVGAVRE